MLFLCSCSLLGKRLSETQFYLRRLHVRVVAAHPVARVVAAGRDPRGKGQGRLGDVILWWQSWVAIASIVGVAASCWWDHPVSVPAVCLNPLTRKILFVRVHVFLALSHVKEVCYFIEPFLFCVVSLWPKDIPLLFSSKRRTSFIEGRKGWSNLNFHVLIRRAKNIQHFTRNLLKRIWLIIVFHIRQDNTNALRIDDDYNIFQN